MARADALRECASLLLILTPSSADLHDDSAREWRLALKYKKPIITVRKTPDVDFPLLLGKRTPLDFAGPTTAAIIELRQYLDGLNTAAGQLRELEYRLADAKRERRTASPEQRLRIDQDVAGLEAEIKTVRAVAQDPEAAIQRAGARTEAAMQRERQPEHPAAGRAHTKFINPPPLVAPSYFQDRHVENKLVAEFLNDPGYRLLTVAGRGGVGKTAMLCRLLKALESGSLPDDLGELRLGGIVYLSAVGTRRVSSLTCMKTSCACCLPTGRRTCPPCTRTQRRA